VPLGRGIVDDDGVARVGPSHPVLVFRYPSMADNTRTLLATALPYEGFLFSKGYVHGIRHQDGVTTERLLALLAYLNSFVADWWVRRFVDRHVTKPVLVHLPLPDWPNDVIDSAADLAWEMLARNGLSVMAGGRMIARNAALGDLSEHELLARIEHLTLQGFDMKVADLVSVLSDFSDDACPEPFRSLLLAYP
jgi:hypothetical protein